MAQQQEISPAQMQAMTRGADTSITTASRQVLGGFIVNGEIQYAKDGSVVAVQRDEAVAITAGDVSALIDRYHMHKTFKPREAPAKRVRK